MPAITIGELKALAWPMLQRFTLTDVSLVRSQVESSYPPIAGPFEVQSNLAVRADLVENGLVCHSQYVVEAFGSEDHRAWRVQVEMAALFVAGTTDSQIDYALQELNAFAVAVGSTTIHPYVRSYVQETSARLGYPPFTLDLMHSPTSGAPDDLLEWFDSESGAFEELPPFDSD